MQNKPVIAVYSRPLSIPKIEDVLVFLNKLKDNTELYISKPLYDSFPGLGVDSKHVFTESSDFPVVDILVSIGGDGTLLDCVSLVRDSRIPIWGVNTGRLGFLAFTSIEEANQAVDLVLKKKYSIESRSMIEVEVEGESLVFSSALNEVTVQKQDPSMITIHAYLDGEFLGTYWADGVIVATPTGSTAYSLSIGGPIVAPDANVFSISPIAPHNLNMRPLVIPDSSQLRLEVESRFGSVIWSMDNNRYELKSGGSLLLRKSGALINFIKFEGSNFCINLRNKLLWGLDKRN